MKQGLGSGDPIGRQWAGVWVMRRLCWAPWFGGQPKQSYPGGGARNQQKGLRSRATGLWSALHSDRKMGQNVIGCGGISVSSSYLLWPAARTHGHSLGSPGPCFHCHHDIVLGVFTVCVHQHFRSRPQPGRASGMSSKEQKDTERSAKRPKVDQNLPSDALQKPDSVTPGNN